jgi:ABC-2 type transport system permease protein
MTRAAAYAGAGMAVLKRDFLTALSYRVQLVGPLLGAFFSLTIFYYVSRLVRVAPFDSADDYFAFVLIGIVILQVLQSILGAAPTLVRQELVAGTFERIVVSPFGPVGVISAMLLFPLVLGLVTGTMTLLLGALVFGADLDFPRALLGLPVTFLGALAFAPFGILSAAMVLVVKQAALGVALILAAISLMSGLYFPVNLLPDWIQWTADVQPFTPTLDLMRHVVVDAPLRDPASLQLAKIVGFTAAMVPLSLWVLARTIRFTRRRGTIIEY